MAETPLGGLGFGLCFAFAGFGVAEGGFAATFSLQNLALLFTFGAQDFRSAQAFRFENLRRAFRARLSSGGPWRWKCLPADECP
jgi:hypothetical protein